MTTAQNQNRNTASKQFITMLKIAAELGCQLHPTPSAPSILRGLCPFHAAETLSNADTLMVNITTTRFWCINCPAQGNPTAFAAKAWQVTARDARLLIDNNPAAGSERPPYPDAYHQPPQPNSQPRPQNTALLTRAALYYAGQLYKSYDALHFLARLGIHPQKASKAGIGYCPGNGLRDHLLQTGITEQEIAASPLFQQQTGMELFNGRITLPDRDYTGATMWMTSFPPDPPNDAYRWRQSPNATMGLPGLKPYLFNTSTIDQPTQDVILTDDHRLFIALHSQGHPVILVTQRRRDRMEMDHHVNRITDALAPKSIKSMIIAMHDRALRDEIKSAMAKSAKAPSPVTAKSRNQILDYINLSSRDLKALIAPDVLPEQPHHTEVQLPQPEESEPEEPTQEEPAPEEHAPDKPMPADQPPTDQMDQPDPRHPEDHQREETLQPEAPGGPDTL